MYLLIEFIKSKDVNIVPAEWYSDGETFWPSYTKDERVNAAISNRESPGEDWKKFDVRVYAKAGMLTLHFVLLF